MPRARPSSPADRLAPLPAAAAGPRVLLVGPPGAGRSRHALAAFDDGVERFGPDRCLLVLPTYGEVEHHKRLAVSRREERRPARGILDLSYATFTSLAERLVPDFRVRDLPSRRERDLLAEEAFRAVAAPVFAEVVDRPGLRARFLRLVKELKQSGEAPDALRARLRARRERLTSPTSRETLAGFLDVWAAYDARLAAVHLADHEDVLRSVVARARTGGAGGLSGVALVVVDGFEDLSGVEAALLRAATDAVTAAGGRVIVTLPADDAARPWLFPRSARLRATLRDRWGFAEVVLPTFARATAPSLARLATAVFAPPDPARPRVPADDALRSIVGADPADEIDRIGREILRLRRDGEIASFREVGVVVRRLDGVGPAMRRALEALGIPARLSTGGARLSSEAVVRAARGPLALLAGDDGEDEADFDPFLLLDHLRWRALASGAAFPIALVDGLDHRWRTGLAPSTWGAWRDDVVAAGPGPAAVAAALDGLRARARALDAAPPSDDAGAVWALLADAIGASLPLPAGGALDADGRPLDPDDDARVVRARTARARLLALAHEGARAAPGLASAGRPTVRAAVDDLLAAADDASAEPPDRRLDTVHLLDVEEARHWELPVVFVAGLVDRAFPLRPREDVLLRDEDRERLAGDDAEGFTWRTAREAEADERRFFLVALTRARRRLYLTRPAADEDGRAAAPSPFVAAVAEALGRPEGDPDALLVATPDLRRDAPPPEAAVVPRDLERFMAAHLGALATPAGDGDRRRAVALARTGGARAAALLARGARFLRPAADPTGDAVVAPATAAVAKVSPTSLEAGAACLHRFFLTKVLRLDAEEAPFGGVAFGARTLGELLHAALHRAVLAPAARPEAVAQEVVGAAAAKLPDPADRAFVLDELTRVVTLFRLREAEGERGGFVPAPADLEVAFGGAGREVWLGDGAGRFALTGRVDRVDTDPPARRRAIVVDYKSGATGADREARRALAEGDALQLPLYALALEATRDVRVEGLELVAGRRRGRAAVGTEAVGEALVARAEGLPPRVRDADAFRALLEGARTRARDVVAAVRAGRIDKNPADAAVCDRCPARGVCRPDVDRFAPAGGDDDGEGAE
ncbi:MAG: PD-(D/E)XK nuclease family protein [Planctomycetia bacterium]|nr:PD-(D/E)XK nuclease family protein [Planctomycetia bacterium]